MKSPDANPNPEVSDLEAVEEYWKPTTPEEAWWKSRTAIIEVLRRLGSSDGAINGILRDLLPYIEVTDQTSEPEPDTSTPEKWAESLGLKYDPDGASKADKAQWRKCGICGDASIQRGVDWPWWKDGSPVHPHCLKELPISSESATVDEILYATHNCDHENCNAEMPERIQAIQSLITQAKIEELETLPPSVRVRNRIEELKGEQE